MVGKELWQFPTTVTYKPQSTRGCCAVLHLHEENARFVLLAIILSVYLLSGAAIFHCVERSQEIKDKQNYTDTINRFLEKHHRSINKSELLELLYIHGNASMQGLFYQRERWDFPGAFYFVGTLVSTIGTCTVFNVFNPIFASVLYQYPLIFILIKHFKQNSISVGQS